MSHQHTLYINEVNKPSQLGNSRNWKIYETMEYLNLSSPERELNIVKYSVSHGSSMVLFTCGYIFKDCKIMISKRNLHYYRYKIVSYVKQKSFLN